MFLRYILSSWNNESNSMHDRKYGELTWIKTMKYKKRRADLKMGE